MICDIIDNDAFINGFLIQGVLVSKKNESRWCYEAERKSFVCNNYHAPSLYHHVNCKIKKVSG